MSAQSVNVTNNGTRVIDMNFAVGVGREEDEDVVDEAQSDVDGESFRRFYRLIAVVPNPNCPVGGGRGQNGRFSTDEDAIDGVHGLGVASKDVDDLEVAPKHDVFVGRSAHEGGIVSNDESDAIDAIHVAFSETPLYGKCIVVILNSDVDGVRGAEEDLVSVSAAGDAIRAPIGGRGDEKRLKFDFRHFSATFCFVLVADVKKATSDFASEGTNKSISILEIE